MNKYLLYYFLLINIVTFCSFGIDKYFAKKKMWRISESMLLGLSFIGGIVGAVLASKLFHHKTIKKSFYKRLYLILIIYIFLFILLLYIYL